MATPRRHRIQRQPTPRPTDASRAFVVARSRARLTLQQIATALGVHARTVGRWESGKSHPSREDWSKVVAYLTRFVPQEAAALTRAAGVDTSPSAPSGDPRPVDATTPHVAPLVDVRAIEQSLMRAADLLDVSPRRVRAAVREIVRATTGAHGTLADLGRAAEEPPREPGDGG